MSRVAQAHVPLSESTFRSSLAGAINSMMRIKESLRLHRKWCMCACRVDVTLKRFKDNFHVGMSTPFTSARDCKLSVDLIRAQWEHASTAESENLADPFGGNAVEKEESHAKL